MNEIFSPPQKRPTTNAAEGLPRWRWTTAEIERMAEAGFFPEDERIELVGGEVVPMSPKGRRHEMIRAEIAYRFTRQVPDTVLVVSEPQFNLNDDTYNIPDLLIYPRAIRTPDVRGKDVLLVIEIADTSLRYDLKTKAELYALNDVAEYWVVHAGTLETTVHLRPSAGAYTQVTQISGDAKLVSELVPELAVTIANLLVD